MTTTITPLIAGNWKMNGLRGSLDELTALAGMLTTGEAPRAVVVICPPATIVAAVARQGASAGILAGGQDCHAAASGAHTGDIAAGMLADAGAQYVIVGHSERRAAYGETDDQVRAKAEAAIGAGLKPIICVGETEAERDAGNAEAVVANQLAGSIPDAAEQHEVIVAYEPIWAIGTGRTPSNDDIAQMHGSIRRQLTDRFGEKGAGVRILYGGSLKPQNAREILQVENVNGGLVGGASLLAKDFYTIISAV
ncbi:MAG: triose-phosphate isomerase [Alphaproteobacteria bacterium]|nr:triose-phosphate isomerase [Alphaproteobacteria bacterium]MBU1560956.1 triose-phosphate isomerase [Alphaproteobacteria bacterium]MBU2304930.1 triose-phosphate isomerase [Alphaproteobacteria bacterium]MBU2370181.1 triose-phosphate isomerase [Alphaproteobacteria bacterium]